MRCVTELSAISDLSLASCMFDVVEPRTDTCFFRPCQLPGCAPHHADCTAEPSLSGPLRPLQATMLQSMLAGPGGDLRIVPIRSALTHACPHSPDGSK